MGTKAMTRGHGGYCLCCLREVSGLIRSLAHLIERKQIHTRMFIGFEALHGEVSIYIWFAVTQCVCLLAK